MHTVGEERDVWVPVTPEEKSAVREQMERLLETSHFKNSRRYPALFRFIVEETLEGRGEFLKERLLGVRVFDRPPDYDTAADPIVRVTIAEIRKRIAQYYHEEAHESEMRIELLPGKYTPEFRLRRDSEGNHVRGAETGAGTHGYTDELKSHDTAAPTWKARYLAKIALSAAIGLSLGIAVYFGWRWTHPSAIEQLWHPFLASKEAITFYLPLRPRNEGAVQEDSSGSGQESSGSTFLDHMSLGENVVFSDVLATHHIATMLAMHHRETRLRMNATSTFEDLRQGPSVLIGGLDNQWAMRTIKSLRYQFSGSDDTQYCIFDIKQPTRKDWCVRIKSRYPLVTHDYAIVARLHNQSTGEMQMVIAGIGMTGTAAAGEFVVNPQQVAILRRMVGRDFSNRNFEAVLSADVVNGISGSPSILAVEVW